MKRLGLAIILLAAAWFGLKDMAMRAYLTQGGPSLPDPLSYTAPEHWATQPETIPPGAWETPWGIDAFIVLPPADLPTCLAKAFPRHSRRHTRLCALLPGPFAGQSARPRQPNG